MFRSSDSVLSATNISHAIERGLTYLHQTQRRSGEFATYASPRLDMQGGVAYSKSVYMTTFVIHSLCYLPEHPLIKPMQQRAAEFLLTEKEDFGGWNYDGKDNWRVPPDLDDTSCAIAALFKVGYQPDYSFYMLLWQNEVAPSGPYYTWIGINELSDEPLVKEVDGLVNCNVLYCASLLSISLPNTVNFLIEQVKNIKNQASSIYSVSPHFFIYTLCRAYADGQVEALSPIRPILNEYILNHLSLRQTTQSTFNLACLAISDFNLYQDFSRVEPYLTTLLNAQQADGGWPAWAAYASYTPNYDGSPALTTALVLELLGKCYNE